MRLHRWFAPLFGALATVGAVESASAQQPNYPMSGSAYADPTGAFYQVPGAGAAPGSFNAWPAVSPYQMDYGQHINENGLWNYDNQSHAGMSSHWKFRSEYIQLSTKRPQGYVGHKAAPTYKQQLRNSQPAQQQGGGGGGQQQQGGLGNLLNQFEGTNNFGAGFNWYDPIYGGEIDTPKLNGVLLSLNNLNPDGSGLEFFASWAVDDATDFDSRKEDIAPGKGRLPSILNTDVLDQIANARAPQLLLQPGGYLISDIPGPIGPYQSVSAAISDNLLNLRGIPLDDGTLVALPDGTVVGGANAVYDINFRIKFSVEQTQTGLRWQTMPWIKNDWIRVNPNVGLRFGSLEENFAFFGQHSGWQYNSIAAGGGGGNNQQNNNQDLLVHSLPNFRDDDGDGVIDNAGIAEGGQGQGQGGGGGQAQGGSFQPPTNSIYPITSILNSRVRSYLAGPELGVSYVMGGESFRIGGRSTFALLANHERMRLSGDNIFVTTRESNLITPTTVDPRPNDFYEEKNSTHVSPLFEQNIYVEGPFFRYVPLLRRSQLLSKATLNVGYTLTYIGEVTRPDENILWRGNPAAGLFPSIQTGERMTWKSDTLNVGVTWQW